MGQEGDQVSMISGVSCSNSASYAYQAQPPPAKPNQPQAQREDTVHLSQAAKAAGDVDRDGDSH